MQRRPIHRLIACLMAPVLLLVNAAPATLPRCASSSAGSAQKTCCGCCQARLATQAAHAERPCCKAKAAANAVATAATKCCCSRGQERPAAPAQVPNPAEQLAKQILAGLGDFPAVLSPALTLSCVMRNVDAAHDIHEPPVRVRFSIWLI